MNGRSLPSGVRGIEALLVVARPLTEQEASTVNAALVTIRVRLRCTSWNSRIAGMRDIAAWPVSTRRCCPLGSVT